MKTRFFIQAVLALFVTLVLFSCRSSRHSSHTHRGSLPPGQAKKIYGHQSAKAFAPGQQKKKRTVVYRTDDNSKGKKKKKH